MIFVALDFTSYKVPQPKHVRLGNMLSIDDAAAQLKTILQPLNVSPIQPPLRILEYAFDVSFESKSTRVQLDPVHEEVICSGFKISLRDPNLKRDLFDCLRILLDLADLPQEMDTRTDALRAHRPPG